MVNVRKMGSSHSNVLATTGNMLTTDFHSCVFYNNNARADLAFDLAADWLTDQASALNLLRHQRRSPYLVVLRTFPNANVIAHWVGANSECLRKSFRPRMTIKGEIY